MEVTHINPGDNRKWKMETALSQAGSIIVRYDSREFIYPGFLRSSPKEKVRFVQGLFENESCRARIMPDSDFFVFDVTLVG